MLSQLVKFSNFYGANEELVLAGGGNTSAKDGDIMYIKGSGTRLATITADGFVKMSRSKIAEIFTKKYPDNDKEREALSLADLMAAKLPGQETKRPSVETTLHSLFPQRFVLHLHPSMVNGITCAVDGKLWADKLFGSSVLWVEPCKPGYILAKICYEALNDYKTQTGKDAEMLLLANHGIFIASDTVDGLGEKLFYVMSKIRGEISVEADLSVGEFDGEKAQAVFNTMVDFFGENSVITYEPSVESLKYAEREDVFKKIYAPFNPDQIVYCNPHTINIEDISQLEGKVNSYKENYGFLPKIIFVKNCGIYGIDYSENGSETAVMLFNDAIKIAKYAENFGGASPLPQELTDFIVNWEAESYRSKQN